MDGRVKTLNPIIFGGILADRANEKHVNDLKNWNESYFNKCIDTRIAVKYALMKMYFNEMLVDNIGGAYDRVS